MRGFQSSPHIRITSTSTRLPVVYPFELGAPEGIMSDARVKAFSIGSLQSQDVVAGTQAPLGRKIITGVTVEQGFETWWSGHLKTDPPSVSRDWKCLLWTGALVCFVASARDLDDSVPPVSSLTNRWTAESRRGSLVDTCR